VCLCYNKQHELDFDIMLQVATKLIDTLEIPIKDIAGQFRFVGTRDSSQKFPPVVDQAEEDRDKKEAKNSGSEVRSSKELKPFTPNSQHPASRFYIDPEDELEVSEIASSLAAKKIASAPLQTEQLDNEASKLAALLDPALSSQMKAKLAKIIVSLLKGIRNTRQTKEVLMRETSLGGLGLLEQKAEEIIEKIAARKTEIFNKIKGDKLEKDIKQEPVISTKQKKIEDIYEAETGSGKLLTEVKPRGPAQPGKTQKSKLASYTPSKAPKPVGPVEEMRLISLKDFRHLGKTPKEAAQRVFQKVDLLGDESLELKAQAIKAWKESPVYQAYLDIGNKSMAGASSVEDIIRSKSVNDMTLGEFGAIADLNKSLRF